MSVPLTGTGGFFTRAGAIIGEFNRATVVYGSALTTGVATIYAQFAGSDQAAISNLPAAVTAFQSSAQGYQNTLIQDGQLAAQMQVNDNAPLVPYTFQQAVMEIAAFMATANAASANTWTVAASVVSAAISASVYGVNYSDAVFAVGFTNQYGDNLDLVFAETINGTCTQPSPIYQETVNLVGGTLVPGTSPSWPSGSGVSVSLNLTDPNNCIPTDGAINVWGGTGNNTPTNWTIVNGAAGVTVTRGSSPPLSRAGLYLYNAQIVASATLLTALQQTVVLQPQTVYAWSIWIKNSTADATGIFEVALVDENGNIITVAQSNGEAAIAQAQTITIGRSSNVSSGTNIGATYTQYTGFFVTPRQLPVSVGLRAGISTLTTGTPTISFGMFGLVAAQSQGSISGGIYPGGPFVVGWSNNKATALGDNWSIAVSNGATSKSFTLGFDRLYNARASGLYFPSYTAASATLANTLVTH